LIIQHGLAQLIKFVTSYIYFCIAGICYDYKVNKDNKDTYIEVYLLYNMVLKID